MTVLSDEEIGSVAAQAGFTGDGLVMAIAVALAESGGDPSAAGKNGPSAHCPNGSTDRGLWQINDCWHPEFSDAQCYDPKGCAQAAYTISNQGADWSPWNTYKNGSYQQFMARARAAAAAVTAGPSSDGITWVQFSGAAMGDTVGIFDGPSSRAHQVGDAQRGEQITFDAWMRGETQTDLSLGTPDNRWFHRQSDIGWTASAWIDGNPPDSTPV